MRVRVAILGDSWGEFFFLFFLTRFDSTRPHYHHSLSPLSPATLLSLMPLPTTPTHTFSLSHSLFLSSVLLSCYTLLILSSLFPSLASLPHPCPVCVNHFALPSSKFIIV